MPIILSLLMVIAATMMCVIVGRWIERRFGEQQLSGMRFTDVFQLWALRGAGIWLVFWMLVPAALARQPESSLTQTNAQQILLSNQKLENVEARIASLEALRLDTRLALVEDTREEVRTMRQWMLGILGGVVVIVITQILAVLGRSRDRKDGFRR